MIKISELKEANIVHILNEGIETQGRVGKVSSEATGKNNGVETDTKTSILATWTSGDLVCGSSLWCGVSRLSLQGTDLHSLENLSCFT